MYSITGMNICDEVAVGLRSVTRSCDGMTVDTIGLGRKPAAVLQPEHQPYRSIFFLHENQKYKDRAMIYCMVNGLA